MTHLILTTAETAVSHLIPADRVMVVSHRLVTGPVPVHDRPETFFEDRRALYDAENLFYEPFWFKVDQADSRLRHMWRGLPDLCRLYDRVTIFADPAPNAQLVVVQLLDWLGRYPEIAGRLWLRQAESWIAEKRPGDWIYPAQPITMGAIDLAVRCWAAFRAPSPVALADLACEPDTADLPALRWELRRLLDEFPDETGLGASERRLLHLTERAGHWDELEKRGTDMSGYTLTDEERTPAAIIQRCRQRGRRLSWGYWELGEALCTMARADDPALSGITERHFSMDAHSRPDEPRPFRRHPAYLTDFGRELVARGADWSRRNPVCRWVGGTKLTHDALWRWDARSGVLVAPG